MKKAKLKEIEILFENCEYCIIPAKYIENFSLDSISSSIRYSKFNGIHEFQNYNLVLQLEDDYIRSHYPQFNKDLINDNTTIFSRIRDKDIVSIRLVFSNSKIFPEYYVPWDDSNEYINEYQTISSTENSTIIRVCEDNKK